MKTYGLWTLFVAISISIVAAYYSIVGLAALFASAMIPVIIMGTVLEISKITTTVWLHLNWKSSPFLIKTYLTTATIVLMLITSMGIFGFLSKAHIEQNAVSTETTANIDQIDYNINEQNIVIKNANNMIDELSKSSDVSIAKIQSEIDLEQSRIDKIVARVQPSIDEQNKIINQIETGMNNSVAALDDEIKKVTANLDALKTEQNGMSSNTLVNPEDNTALLDKKSEYSLLTSKLAEIDNLIQNPTKQNITTMQTIVGVIPADGINGKMTVTAVQSYRNELTQKIASLDEEIQFITSSNAETKTAKKEFTDKRSKELVTLISTDEQKLKELKTERDNLLNTTDPRIVTARENIDNIRKTVSSELDRSNKHIQALREDLDRVSKISHDSEIKDQQNKVSSAKSEIDALTKQKFVLQSDLRKLEADVGPVKYIAELIYGNNADNNTLETAVRWVILMLVFVFDPLAISLVLAGIRSIEFHTIPDQSIATAINNDTNITIIKPKRKYTKKAKIDTTVSIPADDNSEIQLELELTPSVSKEEKKITPKPKPRLKLEPNQVAMNSFNNDE